MLEETLIPNQEEWDRWANERRKWDYDFEPETSHFPCIVLWNEITSNDWPIIIYRVYKKANLENLINRIDNLATETV